MESIAKIFAAFIALVVAWQAGQAGRSTADPAPNRDRTAERAPQRVPVDGQYRGMAIQLHGGPDVYERYRRLIPEIAELGADTVLFVVHGWQDHAGSLDLHIDAQKTAHPAALGKLCDLARSHGLRVILMPIVLLAHPRNSEWRGQIVPPGHDWDAWFERYRKFIVHFAQIAERHNVSVFMIGSELIKSEGYKDRWLRVIEEVRQHYRGKLGYSANWDHYQTDKIGFWPRLDCVGMTTYYKLADGPNPSIEEVDENWARIRKEIKAFRKQVRKPILFTEVGWCSQEGAAREAWNYYAHQEATPAGQREQAVLYESFLKTWADDPGVGGIIWWEWDLSEGGPGDYNYTPRGKTAEKTLRRWFAEKPAGRLTDRSGTALGE